MKLVVFLTVANLIFLSAGPLFAEPVSSIYCGTYVIEEGESSLGVLEKCGEPTIRDGWIWTYDMGPTEPLKVFHMEEGKVSWMEEVPR